MTWIPLLLADQSPNLRYLVLTELLKTDESDAEIKELLILREKDRLVSDLIKLQSTKGFWEQGDFVGGAHRTQISATAQALYRLGYLGFDKNYPPIVKGANYLFSVQRKDGSWSLPPQREKRLIQDGYEIMSLQTSIPLRALAMCGYSTDERCELAYDWLIENKMDDGAWPTGIVRGNFGYVAGYRKIVNSRWGCRSNTTGALSCFSLHPKRKSSSVAKKALDLLLGRDTKEQYTFGFEVARTIGFEQATGFITYFARFDLSYMLDLCWRVGGSLNDSRITEMVNYAKNIQGKYGLWEYLNKPQASRWVSFDLLRSLTNLDNQGDWINLEPKIPFQAYPKSEQRF